jgi:hypothetical protein
MTLKKLTFILIGNFEEFNKKLKITNESKN